MEPQVQHEPFESIQIGLASPEQIRAWSYGEVKKPETINYRTLKPERDGLFCERIFGPTKDWECHCGKYKRMRYKDKICERCGVKVTKAKVRRERMGHIELAAPVSHIWYFKGIPSRMGLLLDITPRNLEKVLYFAMYIVTDPGDTPLLKGQTLDDKTYAEYRMRYEDDFKAGMGAEAVYQLLAGIQIPELHTQLKAEFADAQGQKRAKLLKRLECVEAFLESGNRPEWMILKALPVIPPEIRPMVQLDGGRFATSDLNDLYRRVINRNNRLQKLLELGAPEIIVRNEKRMLQESVDALIDNGRRGRPVTGANNRAFKSLSDMLKGKQGRFRQNLLGKRVDYSGRSVIVVGPELKIYQCGLPKEMALELFKPFVMKQLVQTGRANNVKSARKMVERVHHDVWDALEVVIDDHPVMINRAPTLHRLSIQAFEPVLVEGRAVKLHPLVCTAFNADFDGDQMAVHVPLSVEAQAEARLLMLAANNLLKPSDGRPVTVPTQDMVLGSYYLTYDRAGVPGEGSVFSGVDEAIMAYDSGILDLHAKVRIRLNRKQGDEVLTQIVETTLGRVIFNEPIPQDLGFVNRNLPANALVPEIDFLVDKSQLGKIIDRVIRVHGTAVAAEVLDKIKAQGYKYATRSGITVAVNDATIPPQKAEILAETEQQIADVTRQYKRGWLSNEERSARIIEAWKRCTNRVAEALEENFDEYNPINMMLRSGARGNKSQLRQLAGMRGLIANTAGKTIEVPIRANYREGLNILEYFIASRGARKGLADTALRTADSGYLTRRLVDVSQDVIIREHDCGVDDGSEVFDIYKDSLRIVTMEERLMGRFLLHDLVDAQSGELVHSKDVLMSEEDANKVAEHVRENAGEGHQPKIKIRSLLTCKSERGVCIKCYGTNLATGAQVTVGEAVGIIAAQSIGEPGTQLTMRTFHTGGAKDSGDITQGLPRVEELFEARKPKLLALIAEIDGVVSYREVKKVRNIVITAEDGSGEERSYPVPFDQVIKVFEGQRVHQGENLTEGARNPHDILAVLGPQEVHNYLIQEVQGPYRQEGVAIADKHIEVIVRQMMRKLKITDPGNTTLLPGTLLEKREYRQLCEQLQAEHGVDVALPQVIPVLMGITKAALATESFLSAASFQETTRVLTDAAIKGKTDPLIGLKENVIIGKLLPSGTGMKCYTDVTIMNTSNPFAQQYMDAISGE